MSDKIYQYVGQVNAKSKQGKSLKTADNFGELNKSSICEGFALQIVSYNS